MGRINIMPLIGVKNELNNVSLYQVVLLNRTGSYYGKKFSPVALHFDFIQTEKERIIGTFLNGL
jgi:hypothetical protein